MQHMRAGCLVGIIILGAVTEVDAVNRTKQSAEAAYLNEAFAHDLCTRDERALRKLNRELSRRPKASPTRRSGSATCYRKPGSDRLSDQATNARRDGHGENTPECDARRRLRNRCTSRLGTESTKDG